MAKARVENYNGAPALTIDGKVYPPMYMTVRTIDDRTLYIDDEYFKNLGEAGIKVYFLICDTEWIKPGAFKLFSEEATRLLSAVPDAYIVMRISMHASPDWCRENPDEVIGYSDGKKKATQLRTESYWREYEHGFYSFSSEKWRREACEALREIHEMVKAAPFADRVIGYFFAAGSTSEWNYPCPIHFTEKTTYGDSGGFNSNVSYPEFNGVYGDTSPAFLRTFSRYLREKYGTDEKLREAWGDDTVSIDDPKVPNCDARYVLYGADYDVKHVRGGAETGAHSMPTNGTNIGQFLNIDKRRDVFDFYRALALGTAEAIIHFAKFVKELDPDKVTGAFYGSSTNTRHYDNGKVGFLEKVLDSGYIDFLATPGAYENREPGGFTGQRQTFDTYKLKNALFTMEDDTRTHMENYLWRAAFEVYTPEDSRNVMKRDFGRNICCDLQSWWFDQITGGKRYKSPEIYPTIKRMQEIAKEACELDRRKCSEIALIYDEESHHVVSEAMNQQFFDVFRCYESDIVGAPIDRYFHNDMSDPNMPDYKLYIFVNTIYLSTEEREQIKKKLSKNHAVALFLYGAGIMNPDFSPTFDLKYSEELVGMKLDYTEGVYDGRFKITNNHKMTSELRDDIYFGNYDRKMRYNISAHIGKVREIENKIFPLITESDPTAQTVGFFADTGKPALSVKDMGDYVSVYCGSKHINNVLTRAIARFAGCHIYCDSDDVIYVNKNYITFHAASGGEKLIRLPKAATVTELFENKVYAADSDEIRFCIKRGETKMFRYET